MGNFSFKESNHNKHFLYAIPIVFIFTIVCVLVIATGMEFKDKLYGHEFDWIDWTWTMAGGLIGQILQILFILLII